MVHHTDIIQALRSKRFPVENEKVLQAEIGKHLAERFSGCHILREFELDSLNIIDFLLERQIGIEVKIKGAKREIYRQCERYLNFDQVKVFILVTNLSMGFPEEINGKSCYVVKLGQAWL